MLEIECDVLVPAAMEQQITEENASRIQAKVIAEAANGPVTASAHERLTAEGILILPDLLLNAGGVCVSYFEWLKNLSHVRFGRISKRWEERSKSGILAIIESRLNEPFEPGARRSATAGADERELVYSGLEDTMSVAVQETLNTAQAKGIDLRLAAIYNAIRKVAAVTDTSGMMFMK